jgi:exosortase
MISESTAKVPGPRQESLLAEIQDIVFRIPDKGLFLMILAPWLAIFYFVGNSTFGYFDTASLFSWLSQCYQSPGADDEHGVLVPWVILGILWWKRKEVEKIVPRNAPSILILLALAMLVHIAGYILQQPRLSSIALFVGIYFICGLVWGWDFLRKSSFPFCLFIFAIPLTHLMEKVTIPLRFMATHLTVMFSKGVLGIKVVEEGTQIFDSAHTFHYDVAAACSGIKSLLLMLFINTIFAFLSFNSWWKRVLIILLAIPLAITCNIMRLSSIIVAAEAFQQKGGDFVHERLGIIFYIPAFVLLLLINHYFSEDAVRRENT